VSDTNSISGYLASFGVGAFFDGRIDDVRMYDRALSESEIGSFVG
jgi:hypothetical protein